ncbi:MAG: hypothetical protein ACLTFZ_03375 [Lachnospiraceae bacterium]
MQINMVFSSRRTGGRAVTYNQLQAFYNAETLEIKIRANDAKAGIDTSGVDKYYYYIEEVSDENAIDNYKVKTAEELDQLAAGGTDATVGL